jgi:hypothetical protein
MSYSFPWRRIPRDKVILHTDETDHTD